MRLPVGQHVDVRGRVYLFTRDAPGGCKIFVDPDNGSELSLPDVEVAKLFGSGDLRFAMDPKLPAARRAMQRKNLDALPDATRKKAEWRREFGWALLANRELGYPRKPAEVLADVQARLSAAAGVPVPAPSLASAYRYRRVAERPEGESMRGFVFAEAARGNRTARFSPDVEAIVSQAIEDLYLTPQRRRPRAVFDRVNVLVRGIGKEPPSFRTIRRRIMELPPYEAMARREGRRAADQKYGTVRRRPREAEWPGQIYELDAHHLDVIVIDEKYKFPLGRPWITVAIDRYTRMVTGFHISLEPPCSMTLAACMRNAIRQKKHLAKFGIEVPWICWGVPGLVVVDNALEQHGAAFKEAAGRIRFNVEFAEKRTPEEKAKVERFFRTLGHDLIHELRGTTFSNVKQRGDYNSAAMASLTLGQLEKIVHHWVVEIYNRRHHLGIDDTPERKWIRGVEKRPVRSPRDWDDVDTLKGGIVKRKPGRSGIEFRGLHYSGPFIERLRKGEDIAPVEELTVRYDPNNLDHLFVLNPGTDKYEPIASMDPTYTRHMIDGKETRPLTLAQHRLISRYAAERKPAGEYLTINDLCAARDRLIRMIDGILGRKNARGRLRARRLQGDPEPASLDTFRRLYETEYAEGDASALIEGRAVGLMPVPLGARTADDGAKGRSRAEATAPGLAGIPSKVVARRSAPKRRQKAKGAPAAAHGFAATPSKVAACRPASQRRLDSKGTIAMTHQQPAPKTTGRGAEQGRRRRNAPVEDYDTRMKKLGVVRK